jgi:septum formation protein
MKSAPFIYLASQSPRRHALLEQVGIRHELLLPDPDEDAEALETEIAGESPRAYVRRVARLKSDAARDRLAHGGLPPAPILTADTTVAVGRTILAKPVDRADALRMLRLLSGRAHRVLSAVVVTDGERTLEALDETRVRFRKLGDDEMNAYVASDEPYGKAGGYAIQGRAAAFVTRIAGSHSSIVGLPLYDTLALLQQFGIVPLD